MNGSELGGIEHRRRPVSRSDVSQPGRAPADDPRSVAVGAEPRPPGVPAPPTRTASGSGRAEESSDDVEVVDLDGVAVARLGGEVDAAAAPALEDQLIGVTDRGEGLIVDLSGLRYMDSSAVRSLFRVADHLAAGGGQLHVVVPRDSRLVRVLQIIQLDTLVAVHDDLRQARMALRRNTPSGDAADPAAN